MCIYFYLYNIIYIFHYVFFGKVVDKSTDCVFESFEKYKFHNRTRIEIFNVYKHLIMSMAAIFLVCANNKNDDMFRNQAKRKILAIFTMLSLIVYTGDIIFIHHNVHLISHP